MKQLFNYFIIAIITLILFAGGILLLLETELIHSRYYTDLKKHLDFEKAKTADLKVLILGDSQLEDWPFEHCLHRDMKAYFGDLDIGYCNASHYGFGPIEYWHEVKRLIPTYMPNHIILYFYVGNDMSDVIYRNDEIPRPRVHDFVDAPKSNWTIPAFLGKEVDTSQKPGDNTIDWQYLLEMGVDSTLVQYARKGPVKGEEFEGKTINPHLLQTGLWKPDFLYDNVSIRKVESQYGWYKALKYMDKIAKTADSIDASFSVVVIPTNVQVDTLNYNFYRKALFNIDTDLLEIRDAQDILQDYCAERKLGFIDLLPVFKEDCKSEQLFLTNDNHLNQKGHMSAFRAVKQALLDELVKNEVEEEIYLGPLKKTDFSYSLIPWQMECIKRDAAWFENIKEKALVNSISVDSQLFIDARYIVGLKLEQGAYD